MVWSAVLTFWAAAITFAEPEPIVWGDQNLARVLPMEPALAPVRTDPEQRVRLTLPKDSARSGERYLEAVVEANDALDPAELEWNVQILAGPRLEPFAEARHAASGHRAVFQFDARSAGDGLVRVELLKNGKSWAVVRELYTVQPDTPFAALEPPEVWLDRAPELPADHEAWVTFGLPMPRGALWNSGSLRLADGDGNPMPAQFLPTGEWSEHGSLKWLRVDALVRGDGPIRVVPTAEDAPGESLTLQEEDQAMVVDTGAARFRLAPEGALIQRMESDGSLVSQTNGAGRGLYVVDQQDRLGRVADASMDVEFAGPLAACIKISGRYRAANGDELARFNVWLEFVAGRNECRVTHHLVLTRDSNEVWFKEIGWEFDLAGWEAETALYASPRGRPSASTAVVLNDEPVFMAQTHHRRYGGGRDEFEIRTASRSIEVREGEMGDWAAAVNENRGLFLACRESARQHPKAFRVGRAVAGIDLFYAGAGEELDFRSPALVERWNAGNKLGQQTVEETRRTETNAVGWSKTHYLTIAPIAGPSPADQAVAAGDLFTFPVPAVPDPKWTYQTRVVGPLYPRDATRFPDIESFIDEAFAYWEEEQEFLGEYGFVDFFAGPHHTRTFPQTQGRFRASYTLRNSFWLLYLRSGEGKFREMAEWSNRVYLDSYLASWDGPQRLRGLYLHAVGPDDPHASLPYYWEGFTRPGMGTHTNLDQFLLDYWVTGNPRARAGVQDYIDGVKRWWQTSQTDWRILAVLRALNRAYSLTWDPELRVMQEEILNSVYDAESPIYLVAEGRPYASSTYKTQEDVAGLIEGWELHGTTRYKNMASAVSRYWWNSLTPGTRFERGRSGQFLWEQTGAPALAQRLWMAVREEAALSPEGTSAAAVFRFQGVPYALDVVAATDADLETKASWAGAEIYTGQAGLLLSKAPGAEVGATLQFDLDGLTGLPDVQPIGDVSRIGLRLVTLTAGYDEALRLRIPAETEPADFFVPLPEHGAHRAFLDEATPLTLYADGWWKPIPDRMRPTADIYFELPEGSEEPAIYFERSSRLFTPDGSPWPGDEAVRGRVALPADQPGLWRFQIAGGGAVRVANLPPFFAFDNPAAFLSVAPDLLPLEIPPRLANITGYQLAPGEVLAIDGGPGLPFEEGTIEFFYKPDWDSFSIGQRVRRRLLNVETADGPSWSLRYVIDPGRAGWPGHPWSRSHVLEMEIESEGPARSRTLCIRRTIFEEDEWIHVAIVWGQRMFGYTAARTSPAFDVKVFINGEEGKFAAWPRQGNQAASPPTKLNLGPGLSGEIAGLRISSTQRYAENFERPRPSAIAPDETTLFYFQFEEDLEGVDASGRAVGEARLIEP